MKRTTQNDILVAAVNAVLAAIDTIEIPTDGLVICSTKLELSTCTATYCPASAFASRRRSDLSWRLH